MDIFFMWLESDPVYHFLCGGMTFLVCRSLWEVGQSYQRSVAARNRLYVLINGQQGGNGAGG